MGIGDYILMGLAAVFAPDTAIVFLAIAFPLPLVMVLSGFVLGLGVGATPGLGGPMAMAIALPVLISVFGVTPDALLPVFGFLVGIMKGATVGGAVPAILFNTPGTPDSYLTTFDGYPMARRGEAATALRVAHFSSAAGDTFSDIVLIGCAPFLAILVESHLDLPEKAALLIVSISFISAVIGRSPGMGLISASCGLLAAFVGTGESFTPRLTFGLGFLADGLPVVAVIIGILVVGEIFAAFEDLRGKGRGSGDLPPGTVQKPGRLSLPLIVRIAPCIARSALIGTVIGALPGIGSTLAATLGYAAGKRRQARRKDEAERPFGSGAPQGIAATEAANSAVSGANLIPVLSLGIPGNAAAVFLILAADSMGGFNPGPSVFRIPSSGVNDELVIAFGIFIMMLLANLFNWTLGGLFMRSMGFLTKIPRHRLLACVLLLALTSIYVQETSMTAIWITVGFGVAGYMMRRCGMSPLPFVIAFILGGRLEETARQAFSATGGDPWFLLSSPVAILLMMLALFIVLFPLFPGKHFDATS